MANVEHMLATKYLALIVSIRQEQAKRGPK